MCMPFHSIFLQYALSVFNPFGNLPKALRRLGISNELMRFGRSWAFCVGDPGDPVAAARWLCVGAWIGPVGGHINEEKEDGGRIGEAEDSG